jgi:adenosylhomocysteine nucleosidase
MEAELRHLLAAGVEREVADSIWLDRHLTVAGVPLVAVCSGMGMVNAAAATERLIGAHRPRAVLNFGCSGAHRRDILPGDVVIGERSVHHAAVHILASGEELFVGGRYEVGGETMEAADLPSDPALLALAREAAAGWTPEPWPPAAGWPATVPYREPLVHAGAVASADVWTQAHARLDLLHQRHGTLCEDMEAAAIAQVCARHGVPFLTIKDISNNEYHAATDIAAGFTAFPTAEVGKRAAALLLRVVERVGSR